MQTYSSLLDIIPYFVVAGLCMTFFALALVVLASWLEAAQQNEEEQERHLHERARRAAPSPSLLTRQPVTDEYEEARIQKQLSEERERLRRLKDKNS